MEGFRGLVNCGSGTPNPRVVYINLSCVCKSGDVWKLEKGSVKRENWNEIQNTHTHTKDLF